MTSVQEVGHCRLERAPPKSKLSWAESRTSKELAIIKKQEPLKNQLLWAEVEASKESAIVDWFASTCGKRLWATMHEHVETETSRCNHVLSHLRQKISRRNRAWAHLSRDITSHQGVRLLSTPLRSRRRHSRNFSSCKFEGKKCADCKPAWMRLQTWISLPCKHQGEQ